MVNLINYMGLKAQTLMLMHEPLCCTVIVVFLMKKFIQGLPVTVPAAQEFRPLFLKNFLQLLTGQKNLSCCGYINDFARRAIQKSVSRLKIILSILLRSRP